jgi:hypothetical protein
MAQLDGVVTALSDGLDTVRSASAARGCPAVNDSAWRSPACCITNLTAVTLT